jgi:hypothetical protein
MAAGAGTRRRRRYAVGPVETRWSLNLASHGIRSGWWNSRVAGAAAIAVGAIAKRARARGASAG